MRNLTLLEKLESLEKPIRVGIAGGGEFTSGIVDQTTKMQNMETCVIADLITENGIASFLSAGYELDDIVVTNNLAYAQQMIVSGRRVVTNDAMMLPLLPVDAICDVTGDPAFGAEYAAKGISNGKNVVVVNIESDAGVGSILRRMADKADVVYTEADGDQPSLIMALYEYCRCLGLHVEVAGKWTHQRKYNDGDKPRGRVDEGFRDGSKNQIEMCCVANMTGLLPDIIGMHVPSIEFKNILTTLTEKENGGILSKTGIVEAINCLAEDGVTEIEKNLGGGVFVTARGDGEAFKRIALSKGFVHSQDGSRVLLYRPYHFVGVETPITIAKACLFGIPTATPMRTPCADVVAIAKDDLPVGTTLDGIGGTTVRGILMPRKNALEMNALPLVLAQNIRTIKPIKRGSVITRDTVTSRDDFLWKIRAEQDLL